METPVNLWLGVVGLGMGAHVASARALVWGAERRVIVEIKLRRLPPSGELGYPLERLRIRSGRQGTDAVVVAWGFHLDPEFVVFRGSNAFVETAPGFSRPEDRGARDLRAALIADGTLAMEDDNVYVFQTDYVFHSSSLAASVILGRAASGPEEWRGAKWTKFADLDSR